VDLGVAGVAVVLEHGDGTLAEVQGSGVLEPQPQEGELAVDRLVVNRHLRSADFLVDDRDQRRFLPRLDDRLADGGLEVFPQLGGGGRAGDAFTEIHLTSPAAEGVVVDWAVLARSPELRTLGTLSDFFGNWLSAYCAGFLGVRQHVAAISLRP